VKFYFEEMLCAKSHGAVRPRIGVRGRCFV